MKIDPLSTSISLVAIAIALTNYRNDWLTVAAVAVGILAFPAARYLESRQAKLQKDTRLKHLKALNGLVEKSKPISLAFIKASSDEEIAAAEQSYTAWLQECVDSIIPVLGEGEAAGFLHLGVLNAVSIVVTNPQKSLYRWGDKEKYLQRLDIYRGRLAELMKKVQ